MRLIQLLEQKNHFLEKFYSLNDLQIKLLQAGEVETLDEFYEKRQKLLEIFSYLDQQIELMTQREYEEEKYSQHQESIKKLFYIKDQYVTRIMEQELNILEIIESIKNKIIIELLDIQNQKKAWRGYHSKSTESRIREKV